MHQYCLSGQSRHIAAHRQQRSLIPYYVYCSAIAINQVYLKIIFDWNKQVCIGTSFLWNIGFAYIIHDWSNLLPVLCTTFLVMLLDQSNYDAPQLTCLFDRSCWTVITRIFALCSSISLFLYVNTLCVFTLF